MVINSGFRIYPLRLDDDIADESRVAGFVDFGHAARAIGARIS
jgi:hypothetical protein